MSESGQYHTAPSRDLDVDAPGAEIAVTERGDVTLPLERVLTGRMFLTGKTGSGKSNSVSVVAEEILSRGIPLLIVDADGEYVGLKEQYNVLHAGAQHDADIQVGPADGSKLARVALTENVPVVLDVSEFFNPDEAKQLVASVARTLYTLEKSERKPFLLVLEECHEWIPQRGGDDVADMLIRVAKRGRKRGLGVAGLSQRPADVDKSFITQADAIVWHRLTWHNDVSVAADVLGSDYENGVQELADGEAFLQVDWSSDVKRVQWRRKDTPDLGAAPDMDKVLGSTPETLDAAYQALDGDDDDGEAATMPVKRTVGTYTIHPNNQGGGNGFAQLGKPVTSFLGATDGDTVAVEQIDGDTLVADVADNGEWTYLVYEHNGRYPIFSLGAGATSEIGGTPGDTVSVKAGDGCVLITVKAGGE